MRITTFFNHETLMNQVSLLREKLSDLGTQITAFFTNFHHYRLSLSYLQLDGLK